MKILRKRNSEKTHEQYCLRSIRYATSNTNCKKCHKLVWSALREQNCEGSSWIQVIPGNDDAQSVSLE